MKQRSLLIVEREKTHGDFHQTAQVAQVIKDLVPPKHKMSAIQKEAFDMIASKLSRIISGDSNFKDHWADIAGYAELAAASCDKM